MRSSIFSSLISRSSIARSSLQGLIALSALVVLTGAKGQGCGGSDEPPTPPAPDCGPGFHWDTVCSPCEIGEMCEERCVPDSDCPPGWLEQTVCGGTTTAGVGGWTGDAGRPAPPVDPGCWTECVPPRPFCPPGTIEQTVCSGSSSTTGGGGWGSASGSGVGGGFDGAMPAPPGECWTECVPQEPYCPPGTRPQTTCDDVSTTVSVGVGTGGTGGSGGWAPTGGAGAWDGSDSDSAGMAAPPLPGNCWTDCVPDQPYCPPGTRPQTTCEGGSSVVTSSVGVGGAGGAGPGAGGTGGDTGWGGCWTECVPDQPYCPPDTIPQTVCGGSAVSVGSSGSTGTGYGGSGGSSPYPGEEYCWTECVPAGPYCPPGSTPQEVCYDGMPEPEMTTTSSGTGMGGSDGGSGTTSGGGWGGCFIECVPDQPYCPPDTIPQTVCADPMPGTSGSSGTGMGGSPYPGGGCWTECVPVEPYCPPGSIEQTVCSGSGSTGTGMGGYDSYPGECWTECVEGPTCPPGATVRTICEEPVGGGAGGPVCRTECVLMLP
ncbi:hypothetical protein [Sorangium sp. So ce1153]|uniref:hypothetical protein n=1 Tax=Sorangium sp. So ce1153 TaxID=3133333 RepID=UPI003F5F0801